MFLHIDFPFECHILAAIIGREYPEFLTDLALNFLVPGLKSFERFAFLSEKTDPRVATRVVNKGEVEISTEQHDRYQSSPRDPSARDLGFQFHETETSEMECVAFCLGHTIHRSMGLT